MSKKYFITYGTNKYNESKFRLAKQVKELDIFDSIKTCDGSNLTNDFKIKHKDVLCDQHGGGFWIWKIDIINQELDKLNDGDYLVYLDAGCVINKEGKERFIEYFEMLNKSEYGIISFRMHHKEREWTTSEVFNYFNISPDEDIGLTGQSLGGILIMQKKPHLLKILSKVNNVLEYDNKLFTNYYKKNKQHNGFKDCRHDQSIMSIIRKIEGSIVLEDETLSHLPKSKTWPIWAKRLK